MTTSSRRIGDEISGFPYGDSLREAEHMGSSVDMAIFAMPHIRRKHLARFEERVSKSFQHVMLIPNLGDVTNSEVVARDLAGTLGVEIKHSLLSASALWTKRAIDFVSTL